MSAKKKSQLGRYIVHETSTATEKNEVFFCILFFENMSIQQVTVVVFYRPQNGTFLVLTTGVVTYQQCIIIIQKNIMSYNGIVVYRTCIYSFTVTCSRCSCLKLIGYERGNIKMFQREHIPELS